jgi:hypothetical protein
MSAQRTSHAAVAVAAGTAAVVFAVLVAVPSAAIEIRHSSGAHYTTDLTRAYEQCVSPNDTSSDGIAACSPPVTSACDYSRGDVELERLKNEPKINVKLKLSSVSGPGNCTTGPYSALFTVRVTADDPSCTGGQCTWIEGAQIGISLSHHSINNWELDDVVLEDALLTTYGVTAGHVANYEILGVTVFGPDSRPIAAAGVGDHSANRFRSDVTVRYTPCLAPDTPNTGGVPACSTPTWGATCDFTSGEIEVNDHSSSFTPSLPTVLGRFHDLVGASPSCADGLYQIATLVRATGDVCSGAPCTLVDTLASVVVPAEDGVISASTGAWDMALAGPFDTVEVRETFIVDPLGEPLASPGVTNAFVIADPSVKIAFRDPANATDDRLNLKATFPHPLIDPTVGGATFTVTDQNGTIYSVTIPAGSWQVRKPGAKWQYKDATGSLGGVRKVSINEHTGGSRAPGYTIKLKAKDVSLSGADLPSVNLIISLSNAASGTSIGQRNASCRIKPKGLTCHL